MVYGTNMLEFLGSLHLKTNEAKLAIGRALNRSRDRLAVLQASFAPIQDKVVPERIPLRQKIDSYTAAVCDLQQTLEEW